MKYIYISIFFILNLFISNNVVADQSVIKELQKGGKIVFIRHSLAPGNGDPDNIDLKKCDTQRNLNQEGIEQSKKIGKLFSDNNIQIDKFEKDIHTIKHILSHQTLFISFHIINTKDKLNNGVEISSLTNFTLPVPIIKFIDKCLI